jgi:DNA-binding NarL/FixJ family response regulator
MPSKSPRHGLKCSRCNGIVGEVHEPHCSFSHALRLPTRLGSELRNSDGSFNEIAVGIMQDIADGLVVKEIAHKRNLSKRMVDLRVIYLMSAFSARSKAHLVAITIRKGYIK